MKFVKGYDRFLNINEALEISEVRPYIKAWEKSGGRTRYTEWFDNKWRIYLDIQKKSNIQIKVEAILAANGYEIVSYQNNKAVKADATDKTRNHTNITKLLQRFNKDLLSEYNHDKDIDNKNEDYKIVISRHPYDIAGMTTDREWHDDSCMEIRDGMYGYKVLDDVKQGSLVAYAIRKNDTNINNPVGRLLIKPFENKNGRILATDRKIYGYSLTGFKDTVEKWLAEKQPETNGIYTLHPDLYDDGKNVVADRKFKDLSYIGQVEDTNLYIYSKNDRYGLIDDEGTEILKPIYTDIETLNGMYIATKDSEDYHSSPPITIHNIKGEVILEPKYKSFYINGNAFLVYNGKYGLLAQDLTEILPCEYDKLSINYMNNLHVITTLDNKSGVLNLVDKSYIIPCEYDTISIGTDWNTDMAYYFVSSGDKMGLFDSNAKMLIPCQYEGITVNMGYAFVRDAYYNKGLISLSTGNAIIPCKFNDIVVDEMFGRKVIKVKNNDNLYGLYSTDGKELLPCKYKKMSSLNGSVNFILISDSDDDVYGVMDKNFDVILEPIYSNIVMFNDDMWKVALSEIARGTKIGVYSYGLKKFIVPIEFTKVNRINWYVDHFAVVPYGADNFGVFSTTKQKLVVPALYRTINNITSDNKVEVTNRDYRREYVDMEQ
jgi:hypothetical protein